MKHLKKVIALVLTAFVALAVTNTALAASSGTLTVTNATGGQTYTAYKVFNAVYANESDPSDGVVYTVSSSLESAVTAPFSVSTAKASNGEHIIVRDASASDEAVIAWMKENYSAFDANGTELTYDSATGTASATLDYGYYYVTSSLGSVITIDSLHDEVSIVDKNESLPNPPDKIITAEDSAINAAQDQSGLSVDSNDASVGSVESFAIDFDAVNWVQDEENDAIAGTGDGTKTKVTVYNFTDTPTGLAIDSSTVKVYVNYRIDGAQEDVTDTITNLNVGTDGKLSFNIPWVNSDGNFLYDAQQEGSAVIPVHVTYDATVTAAAATAVAPNEVEVQYNNDPDNTVGTDSTVTYTYKFMLLKTDGTNALLGAEFQLFYADADGNKTGDALTFTVDEGAYRFDPEGTVTNIVPAGDDASALVIGLDNASYVLEEVVVPDGYNKAADQAVTGLSRVDVDNTSITTITVVNQSGTELPSTGGIGTTIFYVVGGLLAAGAAVYLIAKKRASVE